MAGKKYWKISQKVMIIMRKNIELITSCEWQIQYFSSDTITTSDIFQYFLTAMHNSHSLILNMIQQFEKIVLIIFTRSGWLKKNIKVNTGGPLDMQIPLKYATFLKVLLKFYLCYFPRWIFYLCRIYHPKIGAGSS